MAGARFCEGCGAALPEQAAGIQGPRRIISTSHAVWALLAVVVVGAAATALLFQRHLLGYILERVGVGQRAQAIGLAHEALSIGAIAAARREDR